MEDNSHLIAILTFDLFKLRIEQAAWRALIVAKLFQHDRRIDLDVWLGKRRQRRRRLRCRPGITISGRWLILSDESRIGFAPTPFREEKADSDCAGQYDRDDDER